MDSLPPTTSLKSLLALLATGASLTELQAEAAFATIMAGDATPAQIGALLMALRIRGETIPELTGAARAMRARMLPVPNMHAAIDVCGTGGDDQGTLNVSTAVTFVVAGAGIPVAKHGNRSASSRSGGADVLAALGVRLDPPLARLPEILAHANCVFLFAPRHHAALRHSAAARSELGIRTLFNLLGPLANPAGVTRQLVGVYDPAWTRPIAEVLAALGSTHAWVVHGAGLDELSLAAPNQVTALQHGAVQTFTLDPAGLGLLAAPIADLRGGDADENAACLLDLLSNRPPAPPTQRRRHDAYRDTVVLNAAAALVVAGHTADISAALATARQSLAGGAALEALHRLRDASESEYPRMNEIRPPDILARICAETRAEITRRRATTTPNLLRDRIAAVGPTRAFGQKLKQRCVHEGLGLIAEIKKASPSGGLIRADFDPAELAHAYAEGGASCLSVLTEWAHFQGAPADLKAVRKAVDLPILRKDFIIDPWQITESRAIGADCILLIVAVLADSALREFEEQARDLEMDVLVEVHNEAELERALGLRTSLIGINNRDLHTLKTDLAVVERLAPLVPPGIFLVAESGIATQADVERMRAAGVHGLLVGESLMRQPDVTQATRSLLGK